MFEIKSNQPVPAKVLAGRPSNKYPFSDMAVKDAFFVPVGESTEKQVMERMRTAVGRWKKLSQSPGCKFRVTACEDPDMLHRAVGIWRIA
jgi:hypothetical protein